MMQHACGWLQALQFSGLFLSHMIVLLIGVAVGGILGSLSQRKQDTGSSV